MKKILIYLFLFICFLPFKVNALASDYKDVVGSFYNVDDKDTVNIYLFYSKTCPHCAAEEEYFKDLKTKYGDKINIYTYEVTENTTNNHNMEEIKKYFNVTSEGVPFTIIGDTYIMGYTESYNSKFTSTIDTYLNNSTLDENNYSLPILGSVNVKSTSLFLITLVLGLIDGFNPCAMWILLLLINMAISMKDRKKMILIGLTFIITSGVIYFLSMLGLSYVIDLTTISYIRDIIAIVAIILGIYNLNVYIKTRKDTGCHVVQKEKRKTIITKINNILTKNNILLMIIGTIALASSVNLVELACSLGFPTIFLEILALNNINGLAKILYLILYIFFYLLDDLIVFFISVFALKATGITTKYNKLVNLIGGILMIIMGILLIFKPSWIMLNFK